MNKTTRRIAVFGATGFGKSYLVKKTLLKGDRRVVIFDPMDEYAPEGYAAAACSLEGLRNYLARRWQEGFCVAYNPLEDPGAQKDPPFALHRLARFLWDVQEPYHRQPREDRKITLVVEEANQGAPAHGLPADRRGFQQIILQGRHRGIDVIATSQRPHLVHADFRANVAETYYFRLGEEADLAVARRQMGPQWEAELRRLAVHEYLRVAGGDVAKGRNA